MPDTSKGATKLNARNKAMRAAEEEAKKKSRKKDKKRSKHRKGLSDQFDDVRTDPSGMVLFEEMSRKQNKLAELADKPSLAAWVPPERRQRRVYEPDEPEADAESMPDEQEEYANDVRLFLRGEQLPELGLVRTKKLVNQLRARVYLEHQHLTTEKEQVCARKARAVELANMAEVKLREAIAVHSAVLQQVALSMAREHS